VNANTAPVFVVTGATSGIGEAIATHLADTGARVLVGARTPKSGDAAAARIRSTVRDAKIGVSGDLSEMTQVRTLAEQVRERTDRLDGLILNAAEIRPRATYETTKLLAAVFAAELGRRTHGIGITANAADPGFVRTNLGRHVTGAFRLFLTLTRPFQSPPRKAAATAIHLAIAPQAATATGGYYTKSQPGKPSPLARDPELGQQLWAQSIALLSAAGASPDELNS